MQRLFYSFDQFWQFIAVIIIITIIVVAAIITIVIDYLFHDGIVNIFTSSLVVKQTSKS